MSSLLILKNSFPNLFNNETTKAKEDFSKKLMRIFKHRKTMYDRNGNILYHKYFSVNTPCVDFTKESSKNNR